MKNNKNKLSTTEKFQEDIKMAMENYYRQAISENVKRALRNKRKLSTQGKVAM
jgi:DNA invertase Pin-like site-specific DNA recombinase